MGLFSALRGWLTSSSTRSLTKGHPDLNPYDVAKLIDELDLVSEARRLGEAGVPSPDAIRPGGAESEAIQRVDKVRQDYVDWAVTRLNVINESLGKADITREVNRARQADKEFERKASSLLSERESVLRLAREEARQLEAELSVFKAKNGLARQAVYPSGARAFFGYALLAFLIVVEGVLNATFFSQGLDSGLIGGAAYAMSLAALNVAVAYGIGRWPSRFVHHQSIVWKVFGWCAVLLALCAMAAVGLSIAHFRDALNSGSTDAAADALRTLTASPWSLSDLMSWGLFALSFVFAGAAFFDGRFSDDLYPGYGKLSKRADEVFTAYDEELQELRDELEELRNEELQLLETAVKEAQGSVSRYAALIDDKRAAKYRLDTALRDAENSLDAVLLKFRQENEVARKGLPRPAYFDEPAQLAPIPMLDHNTAENELCLSAQQQLVNTLLAELQEIRASIQAAFNQKFDQLKPLQHHFGSEEVKP